MINALGAKAARATKGARSEVKKRNKDFPWDEFDPQKYLARNYEEVRPDDEAIITAVSRFFRRRLVFRKAGRKPGLRGIDVGTGANLYPTLTMLPFCKEITLFEHSTSNVEWLKQQHADNWPSWETSWRAFWRVLSRSRIYRRATVSDMATRLSSITRVQQGSVFELVLAPEDRYDIGTMFFVAESISSERDEFTSAMTHFLGALRDGAPFAIALMEHSKGYQVGDKNYPATDIGNTDVRRFLDERATRVVVKHVGTGTNPLRRGYTGMIIACGRAKGVTTHS